MWGCGSLVGLCMGVDCSPPLVYRGGLAGSGLHSWVLAYMHVYLQACVRTYACAWVLCVLVQTRKPVYAFAHIGTPVRARVRSGARA